MNISKKGFVPVIILITILLVTGIGGYIYFQSRSASVVTTKLNTTTTTTTISISTTTSKVIVQPTTTTIVQFENTTTTTLVTTTDWSCGDSITFPYKGESVTYGTVESQGRCWLDRNLGALRVASSYNDSEAYGDSFQWGRLDDGHQNRESNVTSTLSHSDNPGHGNFILAVDSGFKDWRSPQNDNLWQGVSGINNPCPSGWRIPTEIEWKVERESWSEQNAGGAFMSPLKLTLTGFRGFSEDSQHPHNLSTSGCYWSSTTFNESAVVLCIEHIAAFFSYDTNSYIAFAGDTYISQDYRAMGNAVRCIKD
jgi:uncharacterized protein (TIGR02145 family)